MVGEKKEFARAQALVIAANKWDLVDDPRGALGRRHNWLQLLRFCVVGASGYVVNLAVYLLLLRGLDALVDRGKIMVLWKNDGGTWKMHRDTWNSSVTPPQ